MSPRLPTGVNRLPSGRFEAVACLPKRKKARRRFSTAQEAANWRARTMLEAKTHGQPKAAPEFSEALDKFEEWSWGRRPATAKWTGWVCNRLRLVEYFQKPIDLITIEDVERWRRELAADGLSSRTVDHYLERLKRLFSLCLEWGLIHENPLARVRLGRGHHERVRYLTQEEERALLLAAAPDLRRLITVAIHTGARRGELINLTWDQVDLESRTIRIPATETKGKRDRVLYLNEAGHRAVGKRKRGGGYVFPSRRGKRRIDLKRAWKTAIEAAVRGDREAGQKACPSLAGVHFHDLRHTFASRLVMAGEDLYTVSRLLGHASVTQTERYAHLAPDKLQRAVARLVAS